jgi:hypothetical protein
MIRRSLPCSPRGDGLVQDDISGKFGKEDWGPLSRGWISEYPADDFVASGLETPTMTEQNVVGLPRVDSFERRLCLPPLQQLRQAHAKEYLPAGIVHTSELCRRSPRLWHLVQLDVDNRVRENQRLRSSMEENKLLKVSTGKQRLVDVLPPFLRRIGGEVSRKRDIDVPSARSLAYTR